MSTSIGPQTPFADQLHAAKYRARGESFREAKNRVAAVLKDDAAHYHALRDVLLPMRFLEGGRIQAAMGSSRRVTALNCYVSGTIEDSFTATDGIMDRAKEAAATMRMGGGIGYDFSSLRPRGSIIKSLESYSSGPVSFMEIFNAICLCTSSSGHRRGAQMGVLRVDHPDIEEFIYAKHDRNRLTGFNVSVAVTDAFMQAVRDDKPFDLRWGGTTYRTINARDLWEQLMRSTWDWAEPGVLFIDRINAMNNLWYDETIAATNPCGEQPLPPYGACLLGAFNLVKYVESGAFDWAQFTADIPVVQAAMDNVIDHATYPLPAQCSEALAKRRMGLGITGLANAGEALGYLYASEAFLAFEARVLQTLRDEAYRASAKRAADRGPFPRYRAGEYTQGAFFKTLSADVQALIVEHGLRNSHLLSIAPTGTISMTADNVSSGIEPVFDYAFQRDYYNEDGLQTERVEDYGARVFGVRGKRASECSVNDHLSVLCTAQASVDSAVSKTCNVPATMDWEAFTGVYMQAWERGAKGCATFTDGGKRKGILTAEGEACGIDAQTGRRECQ